jgi:hypothetical protein
MRGVMIVAMLALATGAADAQGVKDPATPNTGMVYPVNPPEQPARPNATPNIPPASAAPPLGVRRAHRYGYRARHRH